MSEKGFKVGDFVRMVKDPLYKLEDTWVEKGDIGIVTGLEDSNVFCVDFRTTVQESIFPSNYNLIERIDPKTAFLAELKDLLDRYNASIYVDFDQSDEIYNTTIAVGEDSVKYSYAYGIDTDNVLNYDKK